MPKSSIDRRTPRARTRSTTPMTASGVFHHHALGDLEAQVPGLEPGPFEHLRQSFREAGLRELARREVHGNDERMLVLVLEPCRFVGARFQDPGTELDDEPGLLRERHESSGSINPRSGCCQRTKASAPTQRASRKRHDRLEEQQELASLQRAVQVVLRRVADHRAGAHRLVEHLGAAAT